MKKIYILILLSLLTLNVSAQKIKKANSLYIYGIAFNPMDSVAYLTEIQPAAGAYVTKKTGFLYARNEYSQQLKSYITKLDVKNVTTAVSYATSEKKILKKYTSQKKKLAKDNILIKYIDTSNFKFNPVAYSEE